MDLFFRSNPGMRSRIGHHLTFGAYELKELEAIGRVMLQPAGYYLSEDAEMVFHEYLSRRRQEPDFANARSVRNALERAWLRHASRLLADSDRARTKDDFMRIEALDILASSVFSHEEAKAFFAEGDGDGGG